MVNFGKDGKFSNRQTQTKKIGTPGVHVSTARELEMCYSLGTSVGDVTRLNVAKVVRFSLYIQLIWKFFIVDIFVDNREES